MHSSYARVILHTRKKNWNKFFTPRKKGHRCDKHLSIIYMFEHAKNSSHMRRIGINFVHVWGVGTTSWCVMKYACLHHCLFDLILYVPSIKGIKRRVFLGWTSTKLGLMCFAQRLNAVTSVRLEPAAPRSRVKHSTVAYTIVSIYAVPFDGAHGIGGQTRYKSI